MVVFSSSKVTINKLSPLFSCFFTPSIFFRIEPIRPLEPQVAQPGMVNCTILSAARANGATAVKKNSPNKMPATFFIFHLI